MARINEAIDLWRAKAIENGDEYIISVYDTWDFKYTPVYCKNLEECKKQIEETNGINMRIDTTVIHIIDEETYEDLSPFDVLTY